MITTLRTEENSSGVATRIAIVIGVAMAVIALDQWTKVLVRAHVFAPRAFAGGLFTLMHTENTGAFLSLGANFPQVVRTWLFGGFVAVILVAFTIAVLRGSIVQPGEIAASAAIIGGGFGNLIDRLMRQGRVTDFLYLEVGPLHTGVFNVADMAITFGVLMLLVASFRRPASTARAS